jgi:hypothetical protein
MRLKMVTNNILLEAALYTLVVGSLCVIFFIADTFDGTTAIYYVGGWGWSPGKPITTPLAWAPQVSTLIASLGGIYIFYILAPYAVYHNAKRHGRNAVRWTTAFVVFTPVLAGIAYLLTWPKSQQ